jgi:hypothetical protein
MKMIRAVASYDVAVAIMVFVDEAGDHSLDPVDKDFLSSSSSSSFATRTTTRT